MPYAEIKQYNFKMHGKSFNVVSKEFLIDQYESQWMIPHKGSYDESIRIVTNLIE